MLRINRPHPLFCSLIAAAILQGCAATPSATYEDQHFQGWNKNLQAFNDSVDRTVLKPIAQGYQKITPSFVDQGVSNLFSNVNDIGVTINDFLQLKFSQGSADAGRLLINSSLGLGGLIDVADAVDLTKHNEDFGQTLAVWGVPSGSYFVLPFWGPSSPRDAAGLVGDAMFNPLTYVSIFGGTTANAAVYGARAIEIIDTRANLLTTEKIVNEASGEDHYDFIRSSYKQRREFLINDGNTKDDLDPLDIDTTPAKP
ncbi:hypothetical protein JCM14076_12120 [Methylosoma difficile]